MASARGGVSRVQSARAAAGHKNLALYRRGLNLVALHLSSDDRIDGAASRGRRGALRHAGEAAQAFHNLLRPVLHNLAGQIRIRQQLSCHLDDVGFSGGNNLLHLCRIAQAADGRDRFGDVLFNLRRKEDVAAVIRKHGRMGDAEGLLIGAGRDMDNVHIGLQRHGNVDALIQVIAALAELGAAHTQLDREERSHRLAHGFQHFDREAAAVLQRSAVLIFPVVEQRGEELI